MTANPTPARDGAVSDEMVRTYVGAVNAYLGSMTKAEWDADRKDKYAHLARVARIGLMAVFASLPAVDEAVRRDAERYRWLRDRLDESSIENFSKFPPEPDDEIDPSVDQAIDAAIGATHDH